MHDIYISCQKGCLEITVPSILILWWNRIGIGIGYIYISCQKGFTTLHLENKNLDLLYFCRSRSGTSSFSKAIHLHLSSFSIFLIQVTFKLSIKKIDFCDVKPSLLQGYTQRCSFHFVSFTIQYKFIE